MDLFKLLYCIFLDQRGEGEGEEEVGGGQGDATPKEGQGEASGGEGEGEGEGAGEEAASKYGDFGENPSVDDVYAALQEVTGKHDGLTKKTGQTEKNLASLRKAAESQGLRVVQDAYGNTDLVPQKQAASTDVKRRFTDEHRTKLASFFSGDDTTKTANDFLEIMSAFMQDHSDEGFSNYDKKLISRQHFQRARDTSNDRMMTLYPQLDDGKKESFDQFFFDRATEIYKESYEMHPRGELIAAGEAAAEMGISPITLKKAEAKGFNKGKEIKTVLAPVGQGGKGRGGGKGTGKLGKNDYLALTEEERAEYDKEQKQIK